jgi:hypothetical protein
MELVLPTSASVETAEVTPATSIPPDFPDPQNNVTKKRNRANGKPQSQYQN